MYFRRLGQTKHEAEKSFYQKQILMYVDRDKFEFIILDHLVSNYIVKISYNCVYIIPMESTYNTALKIRHLLSSMQLTTF